MSTIDDILDYRLPARLAELHTFVSLASALETVEDDTLEIVIGPERFTLSKARLLLDVVADGAVVMSRTLLQFLGVSYHAGSSMLSAMRWLPDDIKITDLNLPPVSPTQATSGLAAAQSRAEHLFKLCLDAGNKISAHFTTKNAMSQNASISELTEAFQLVIELVNREVYRRLQRAPVVFGAGGAHGHITRQPVAEDQASPPA
ncbi:hypothetical protein FS827_22310 [Agrobacterium vitis]|uniref:hypothetical protein n=1 Tax=Allorhizobium ampelinum TaxID=3025782 RepID=UPI001F19B1E0|nr:hypothetical protein [Allorhizobium ampelinum]MCF1464041.1 hypothetical protein [Allorhizobium ampelinum]